MGFLWQLVRIKCLCLALVKIGKCRQYFIHLSLFRNCHRNTYCQLLFGCQDYKVFSQLMFFQIKKSFQKFVTLVVQELKPGLSNTPFLN